MKKLHEKMREQISFCSEIVSNISEENYTKGLPEFGNATIGEHMRHCVEIIQALENSKTTGKVDYENRTRDLKLSSDRDFANRTLTELAAKLDEKDRILQLIIEDDLRASTTYNRELYFVIDHTIHHLAMIKTALRLLACDTISDDCGMAYSTISYKNEKVCAR